MQRICLVEDEKSIGEIIQLNLELEGYQIIWKNNGNEARAFFEEDLNFDLIILDVMLPGVNGIDLCRQIRDKSKVPILFLSAKGTTTDRIKGLKSGGNDYLSKPFDLEELLLRVQVLVGKNTHELLEKVVIGSYELNFKSFNLTHLNSSEETSLSKKEIALIQLFVEREGEVVSRDEILDKIWGKDQFPTSRTIDNYILNLRKIFEEDPKNPIYFHSIRGVGYKFTA
ncbi:MAG: response regulator transcription factor [Flavobacteriales bacterium]|nr:response regulator transcription factor [Flavobacteriales bacterium]